jgi:hypothetical protein
MFKRTATRAGLKEALALRNERKIERLREIERLEAELKPARGSSINSYFGGDRDRGSPEVTRNLAGVQYALWEVKEEAFIRSMAAKVLQHRWRLIRCSRTGILSHLASHIVTLSTRHCCCHPQRHRS